MIYVTSGMGPWASLCFTIDHCLCLLQDLDGRMALPVKADAKPFHADPLWLNAAAAMDAPSCRD